MGPLLSHRSAGGNGGLAAVVVVAAFAFRSWNWSPGEREALPVTQLLETRGYEVSLDRDRHGEPVIRISRP